MQRPARRPPPPRPDTPELGRPHEVLAEAKRRDGVTLAATGRVPDRVRAQVLADHHLQHTARARAAIIARVHQGTYPLTIPYGYRRCPTPTRTPPPRHHRMPGRGRAPGPTTARTTPSAPGAPVAHDRPCGNPTRSAPTQCGSPRPGSAPECHRAEVADRLATDHNHPYPLTVTGARRSWTARTLPAVLTDPAPRDTACGGAPATADPSPTTKGPSPRTRPTPRSSPPRSGMPPAGRSTPTRSTAARNVPVSTTTATSEIHNRR